MTNRTSYDNSSYQTEPLFEIELDDASVINKILCEISNPDDNSTFMFTKGGLRLVVNGDRTSQVSAFFSTRTFSSFKFNGSEDCIRYKFSLKDFIETLNLLREDPSDEDHPPTAVSLRIYYNRRGEPLRLHAENRSNYTVDCDLKEFSMPSCQSLMSFTDLEEAADIMFYSKELYKYITGLDLASSTFIKIILEPGDVPVKMQTESPKMGEVELEIRKHGNDPNSEIIKRDLNVPNNFIFNFSYRSKFIAPALEALRTSNYVRMKCGSTGLLLMEHFHGQEPRVQSVEYFVLSEAL